MNIGKSILSIRKEQKMSQEEFGKLFHVTRQTISNWENEKSYPDLQMLVDISEMFEISLDKLLKEDKHMVKAIDKERKYGKVLKGIFVIISILLVIGIAYVAIWNLQKSSYEKNFQMVLKKNGFTQDTIVQNGKTKRLNSYSKVNGNIEYEVTPAKFPKISQFRFSIPDSKQYMTATCRKNGKIIDFRLDKTTNVVIFYKTNTATASDERGEFLNDVILHDDGTINVSGGEIKEIYDVMKSEIQTAAKEMKKMFQNFY